MVALPDVALDLGLRWVAAWSHARDKSVAQVDGWPLVHVQEASRDTELVCVNPVPEVFGNLMRHVDGEPRAMLTVMAADIRPYVSLPLSAGLRVDRDDETLMSTTLRATGPEPADPDLRARWEIDDHRAAYVLESDGRVAAEGTVGILGLDAVFDAIETSPAFQRRGLARHVMAELTACAVGAGAVTGLLAATGEGRRLYEALGWAPALQMWSLMGTAP